MTHTQIGSMGELRDLLGWPAGRVVTKERTRLLPLDRDTPETLEELQDHYTQENYSKLLY